MTLWKYLLSFIFILISTSLWAAANPGEAIYNKSCQTCHNNNTASLMQAPAVHDVAAWKQRYALAQAESKKDPKVYKDAMSYLVTTVKKGKGAMVAGGMCMDSSTADKKCTDADYVAAIKFMSQKK